MGQEKVHSQKEPKGKPESPSAGDGKKLKTSEEEKKELLEKFEQIPTSLDELVDIMSDKSSEEKDEQK